MRRKRSSRVVGIAIDVVAERFLQFEEEPQMSLDRLVRVGGMLCLGVVTLTVATSAVSAERRNGVSPFLSVGPKAVASAAAGPAYGLFTCQVIGRSPGVTCYDPYQMRHAYQTDSLISAGYDGTGQTIVIIDAFQSPTIVSDLATFNAFYGLPPAQLTQIAPFGMVPFNPSDPNMNGWAGEITLDVEWAHAIAPGAKIVLVLARTNNDADIQNALQYAVDHNLA